MNIEQLPMQFTTSPSEAIDSHHEDGRPLWLGLTLEHRALFEALRITGFDRKKGKMATSSGFVPSRTSIHPRSVNIASFYGSN
jgi:hypothetical protein